MAGLWSTLALALLILGLAMRVISRCAIAIGRAWMRADGVGIPPPSGPRNGRLAGGYLIGIIEFRSWMGGYALALAFPLAALVALQVQTK